MNVSMFKKCLDTYNKKSFNIGRNEVIHRGRRCVAHAYSMRERGKTHTHESSKGDARTAHVGPTGATVRPSSSVQQSQIFGANVIDRERGPHLFFAFFYLFFLTCVILRARGRGSSAMPARAWQSGEAVAVRAFTGGSAEQLARALHTSHKYCACVRVMKSCDARLAI